MMVETTHRQGGVREMLAIALPMVVSNACDTVMVFTDRLFLARLNPELMNAAMAGGLTVFVLTSFFIGLTGYTTALAAQYLGAGKKRFCSLTVTQAVILALVSYPVIQACRPLAGRLFEAMGISAGQIGPQKAYFNILLYGVIISLLRNCLSAFFSGIGRTRIVMVASFAVMIINVGLNYVLIYGKLGCPALGITGAAYGTLLGGCCGLLIMAAMYLSPRMRSEFHFKGSLRFNRAVTFQLLRFGSFVGVEMFLNLLAFNTIVLLFHSNGPVTATAATVMFNWDMVSFVPLIGIGIGVTSLVGRYMGAGSHEKAHSAVISGVKVGFLYSLAVLVLFAGFPGFLVNVFRPESAHGNIFRDAAPLAIFMVRLASLYVLVEAVLIVFIGALRGAGDTFWAMGLSISIHWLMVAAIWLMLRGAHASPQAAWTTMVFLFLVLSGFVYLRYKAGKWRKIRMIEPEQMLLLEDTFREHTDL